MFIERHGGNSGPGEGECGHVSGAGEGCHGCRREATESSWDAQSEGRTFGTSLT